MQMYMTKIEYSECGNGVIKATIFTGIPAEAKIYEVINHTMSWLDEQGYLIIPASIDGFDYKITPNKIIEAITKKGSTLYRKPLDDYIEQQGGGYVLIGINEAWIDPHAHSWYVKATIQDADLDYMDNFNYNIDDFIDPDL